MFPDLNNILDLGPSGCPFKQNVLVTECDTDASWIIHHFVSAYLRQDFNVCFFGLAQSFAHYNSVGNKLGVSLSKAKQTGNLVFVEGLNNILGEEEQLLDFTDASHASLKGLYSLTKSSLAKFNAASSGRETLVVIDNLSILIHLGLRPLDIIYFMQYLRQLLHANKGQQACLVTLLRDSSTDEDVELLLNQLRHNSDLLLQVQGLATGYSKDVHGQLIVRKQSLFNCAAKPVKARQVQFKILDKNISVFARGMSSAIL